jgi:hypothetical protein
MVPGPERSLVVLDAVGEVAVALRDRLDPGLVVVKHAYPSEALRVATSCRPWSWMVVGALPELPGQLAPVLSKPVLIGWLGSRPTALPAHARSFHRFTELVDWISQTLRSEVAGIRLSVGSGVELPGGRHVRCAALEALVSAGSSGFQLPLRSFQGAARTLAAHGVPVAPVSDPLNHRVSLRRAPG